MFALCLCAEIKSFTWNTKKRSRSNIPREKAAIWEAFKHFWVSKYIRVLSIIIIDFNPKIQLQKLKSLLHVAGIVNLSSNVKSGNELGVRDHFTHFFSSYVHPLWQWQSFLICFGIEYSNQNNKRHRGTVKSFPNNFGGGGFTTYLRSPHINKVLSQNGTF